MEKNGWKILAIIFILLFGLETAIVIWSVNVYYNEVDDINYCYYDICGEYPDAWYEEGVCYCYEYDMLGDLVVAKTDIIR